MKSKKGLFDDPKVLQPPVSKFCTIKVEFPIVVVKALASPQMNTQYPDVEHLGQSASL